LCPNGKKLVVVVDDNENLAASLAIAFENIPGVDASIAHHPAQALRLIVENDQRVAAIVTDLNLPEVNGFELIGRIRRLDRYRNLPAILISAEENLVNPNGSILNTPNAIFRKPFSIKEVCRVLEELLA